jgi:FAD/FMN-containing dehydrogenase
VFYRDFEKSTLSKGLLLPCYTASKSLNTVGGMVGNNSAGEKSLSYGQTKDYVEELTMVLADGNEYVFGELDEHGLDQKMKLGTFEGQVYRDTYHLIKDNYELIQKSKPTTSKNSAGYLLWEVWDGKRFNLAKLFVGAQGTLGLNTKIKFKLVKPKPKSELLVMFLKDINNLGDLVHFVLQYKPESFESYDNHTFKLAVKFLPEMVMRMKGNVFKLGLQFLPEVWMVLTGGIPKLVLIAEFTGDSEEEIHDRLVNAQKAVAEKFHIRTHITNDPHEAQKYWTIRRESFALLRSHSSGRHTAPFIDDIVVHPRDLPEFLPKLNTILEKYPNLIYTIAGHAGDANFHIIPLMDLHNAEEREIIPKLSHEVYDLVLAYNGSITAEHNDGLIRTPYLEKMYGPEMYSLFKRVKNIFDPKNIFNPRKKVGATEQYILEHIKRA